MSAVTPAATAASRHEGPLVLRHLIEWLAKDGLISPVEAKRTLARCAQAESRQAPLVRLASSGVICPSLANHSIKWRRLSGPS